MYVPMLNQQNSIRFQTLFVHYVLKVLGRVLTFSYYCKYRDLGLSQPEPPRQVQSMWLTSTY